LTHSSVAFTSALHELLLILAFLWVFHSIGQPPIRKKWPQIDRDSSIETAQVLVGDGLDASCGPQLESQNELRIEDDDGLLGSSSDTRKCMKDSRLEFGLEENCKPS
jgi:hypothetical protein